MFGTHGTTFIWATALMVLGVNSGAGETWSEAKTLRLGPDGNACGLVAPASAKPAGVILWLHGGMRSGTDNKGWTAWQAPLPFLRPGSKYVCSPSAFAGADWLTEAGQAHIEALLDYLDDSTAARLDDLILIGVSDGCLGALRYAKFGKRHPTRFVLISSYPALAVDTATLIRDRAYTFTRWEVFQGGRDRLFPATAVFPLLRVWAGANPKVRLHLYPEGEHDYSWYARQAGGELRKAFR